MDKFEGWKVCLIGRRGQCSPVVYSALDSRVMRDVDFDVPEGMEGEGECR